MHLPISAGACAFLLQSSSAQKSSYVVELCDIAAVINFSYRNIKKKCADYANGFANLLVK